MERVKVKFLYDHAPYMAGEIASFFQKEADSLIDRGIAQIIEPKVDRSAARLREIRNAPETRHIPSAPETQDIKGPEASKDNEPAAPKSTRTRGGSGTGRKNAGRKSGGK